MSVLRRVWYPGGTMLDLVLVQPPLSRRDRYGVLAAGGSSLPPFGLAWLAAVARADGYRVAIVDAEAEGLGTASTVARLMELGAPVVGLTATTISIGHAAAVAADLRAAGYAGSVIVGGAHVTAAPEATLGAWPAFDLAVLGEGEATLRELMPLLLDGGSRDRCGSVAGLLLRDGDGGLRRTAERPFLSESELAALPLPAWDLLPSLTRVYQPSALRTHRSPSSSLVTSRGCFGRCTFCDNTVFGCRVRSFPASYVADMVERLVTDYGVRDLTMYDDNFVVNRKRLTEFCDLLRTRNLDITWSCNARVDVIDERLAAQVTEAGCWQMSVGIESGSQEILDRECKGETLEQVRRAVGILHDHGIRTKGFFMVGHPGETEETARATIDLALELPLDDFQMSFLTPFPGTAIHAEVDRWGTLDERWDAMNMWTPVFVPHGMTAERLVELQQQAMRRFYFRPRIVARYLVDTLLHPGRIGAVVRGALSLVRALMTRERDVTHS